jgi:hypothetical protein
MEKCQSGRLAQRKSWTRWWSNPTSLSLCFIEWKFFHGTSLSTYASEVTGVVSCLNAWKYNYMDKIQKKKLCPDDVSPGLGVPSKVGGWDMNEPTS